MTVKPATSTCGVVGGIPTGGPCIRDAGHAPGINHMDAKGYPWPADTPNPDSVPSSPQTAEQLAREVCGCQCHAPSGFLQGNDFARPCSCCSRIATVITQYAQQHIDRAGRLRECLHGERRLSESVGKEYEAVRDELAALKLRLKDDAYCAKLLRLALLEPEPAPVCVGCGKPATKTLWGDPFCSDDKCFGDCYPVGT